MANAMLSPPGTVVEPYQFPLTRFTPFVFPWSRIKSAREYGEFGSPFERPWAHKCYLLTYIHKDGDNWQEAGQQTDVPQNFHFGVTTVHVEGNLPTLFRDMNNAAVAILEFVYEAESPRSASKGRPCAFVTMTQTGQDLETAQGFLYMPAQTVSSRVTWSSNLRLCPAVKNNPHSKNQWTLRSLEMPTAFFENRHPPVACAKVTEGQPYSLAGVTQLRDQLCCRTLQFPATAGVPLRGFSRSEAAESHTAHDLKARDNPAGVTPENYEQKRLEAISQEAVFKEIDWPFQNKYLRRKVHCTAPNELTTAERTASASFTRLTGDAGSSSQLDMTPGGAVADGGGQPEQQAETTTENASAPPPPQLAEDLAVSDSQSSSDEECSICSGSGSRGSSDHGRRSRSRSQSVSDHDQERIADPMSPRSVSPTSDGDESQDVTADRPGTPGENVSQLSLFGGSPSYSVGSVGSDAEDDAQGRENGTAPSRPNSPVQQDSLPENTSDVPQILSGGSNPPPPENPGDSRPETPNVPTDMTAPPTPEAPGSTDPTRTPSSHGQKRPASPSLTDSVSKLRRLRASLQGSDESPVPMAVARESLNLAESVMDLALGPDSPFVSLANRVTTAANQASQLQTDIANIATKLQGFSQDVTLARANCERSLTRLGDHLESISQLTPGSSSQRRRSREAETASPQLGNKRPRTLGPEGGTSGDDSRNPEGLSAAAGLQAPAPPTTAPAEAPVSASETMTAASTATVAPTATVASNTRVAATNTTAPSSATSRGESISLPVRLPLSGRRLSLPDSRETEEATQTLTRILAGTSEPPTMRVGPSFFDLTQGGVSSSGRTLSPAASTFIPSANMPKRTSPRGAGSLSARRSQVWQAIDDERRQDAGDENVDDELTIVSSIPAPDTTAPNRTSRATSTSTGHRYRDSRPERREERRRDRSHGRREDSSSSRTTSAPPASRSTPADSTSSERPSAAAGTAQSQSSGAGGGPAIRWRRISEGRRDRLVHRSKRDSHRIMVRFLRRVGGVPEEAFYNWDISEFSEDAADHKLAFASGVRWYGLVDEGVPPARLDEQDEAIMERIFARNSDIKCSELERDYRLSLLGTAHQDGACIPGVGPTPDIPLATLAAVLDAERHIAQGRNKLYDGCPPRTKFIRGNPNLMAANNNRHKLASLKWLASKQGMHRPNMEAGKPAADVLFLVKAHNGDFHTYITNEEWETRRGRNIDVPLTALKRMILKNTLPSSSANHHWYFHPRVVLVVYWKRPKSDADLTVDEKKKYYVNSKGEVLTHQKKRKVNLLDHKSFPLLHTLHGPSCFSSTKVFSNESPYYFCLYCAFCSTNSNSVNNHMLIVHYRAVYMCGACGAGPFISSQSVAIHADACRGPQSLHLRRQEGKDFTEEIRSTPATLPKAVRQSMGTFPHLHSDGWPGHEIYFYGRRDANSAPKDGNYNNYFTAAELNEVWKAPVPSTVLPSHSGD